MYMNDSVDRSEIREHVVNQLIALGLPCQRNLKNESLMKRICGDALTKRRTKMEFKVKDGGKERLVRVYGKVFGVSPRKLDTEDVMLKTGQVLPVPMLVHDLCEFLLENVETEGIFRKAGSTSRQANIKSKIDGKKELPVTLIPNTHFKLLMACYHYDNKEELIFLAVLLLPIEHLNLLTYLMHFFKEVSASSATNKMTPYNLSVCIAPNIFPVVQFSAEEFSKVTDITKMLIERAAEIGKIPDKLVKEMCVQKGNSKKKTTFGSRFMHNVMKGFDFMTC
ncbi:hypothetical protein NQ317_006061 [Molorchus minor]|uniref:Rho-GAP domain-containing protein n=1 Tax=Molorchus minor TaxID=1323400 RepID=A0ABQ9K353_9CUCU|nr:hypothetical protein NQ317_006061 [Molorchus minor]